MKSWLRERSAGVLLHPTALPGAHGVGTLGLEARRFIDLLARCGLKSWQVCPLGPTGYGNSPYASFSAFAMNPYLVDIEALVACGWLDSADATPLLALPVHRVDYGALYATKWAVLRTAYLGWVRQGRPSHPQWGDFESFCGQHASWLDPFTAFLAIKETRGGAAWNTWPAGLRTWASARKSKALASLADAREAHAFFQYVVFGQWSVLRAHAGGKGVRLIGDIPLFVAYDSADVWSAPEWFQLDRKSGEPLAVAGVPPDYFSADGQLWGNPLYDWKALEADGFRWWMDRLALNFDLCDWVRVDHFRGFESYWSVPAGATTARGGAWKPAPGAAFFGAVSKRFPDACLIAEDLGDLTESVHELRRSAGLPGMAILQFAWGGEASNPYLPHNHEPDCVVYPGTHDNPTSVEWYAGASERERDHVRRYFRVSGQEIAWDLIRASYASPARLAILPLQDLLSLGAEGRFNTPGKPDGNWEWRVRSEQLEMLERRAGDYLIELARTFGR